MLPMTPTRIHYRGDHFSLKADDVARMQRGEETLWFDPPELAGVEAAKPGDCWRVHWRGSAEDAPGPLAGYAICCPKCLQVHSWTIALNCPSRRPREAGSVYCDHEGKGSCWDWTGSAEEGTLSATPSLHALNQGGKAGHGCGWHGYLTNGLLNGA